MPHLYQPQAAYSTGWKNHFKDGEKCSNQIEQAIYGSRKLFDPIRLISKIFTGLI